MESDLPLIEMGEEDDSLIQQFPDLDQTPSKSTLNCATFSPFALPHSIAKKPSSSSSEAISNKENINLNGVEVPKLGMEPMQMKRRKKGGGYNLRKSLAWDRAFFTDEGILDPLELTLITGMDANARGAGLPTISEEGNSSFSSDSSCTNEFNDMEASKEAQNKGLCNKNCTPKGNREKTDWSISNHGSVLHHKVTNKVLSSDCTNRGVSKVDGCSKPSAASSLKRPANANPLKSAKKESKLPKLPISKPGSCVYATPKGSMAASRLRHNLIPKPTKNVEKNVGLKSSLQNMHDSQSKAKPGSGKVQLPVRELSQIAVKNMAHSSKAASSTRSQLGQVDRANSGAEIVPDTLQLCIIQEESTPLAAKHVAQHAAANSNNSLPEAARLSSSGPCHIQRDSNGQMISDRSHPCESQQGATALARPSGLRLPSPSLRLFDLKTASDSGSLLKKKIQHYMGPDKKYGEPGSLVRPPMNSNDVTENIGCVALTSSKESCAPSSQLSPSSNNQLKSSAKGGPDSNIYQNLVTKIVPTVGIKLEYECRGSEQEKKILGHEDIAAPWKGGEVIKVSRPMDQLAGSVGTCHQLMSKGSVPETKYKSVLHNEEDGLQSYTAFSKSTLGQSQEANLSTEVNDLVQTSWEQADTEKSDDAPSKVNPESHLDAGSQVFLESQEQDEIRKREEDDVGTTKCATPGIESTFVLQHGQENDESKVVGDKNLPTEEDNSPCSRTISMTFRDSHSLEDEADVIELKGIDTSYIPFENLNTEQGNDDGNSVDVFPATTTTPHVTDLHAEESNDILISPVTSIMSRTQAHDSPVRDTLTQLLNDNPSAEGFNIEPTTFIENEHQLPVTLVLHDNPSSEGFQFIPTNFINNKAQSQDNDTANGSPRCFEATTPCISTILNSQLPVSCIMPEQNSCLEEGAVHNVSDINDHLSQEKSSSSSIFIEVPGQKDGVDVDFIPREGDPLFDDHNQHSGISDLIIQVEFFSETASVVDDALVKGESVLQGAQCTSSYSPSLEKERLYIAVPTVETQHKIPEENHESQETGIYVVAEKSQDASHENISEAKPTNQGCTGGSRTYASSQILPALHVNGDSQPQGSVGTAPSVETLNYSTNEESNSSFSVSQQHTSGVKTKRTSELCCLGGGGDESLLPESTFMIGAEGSKISIEEQDDAPTAVDKFQHELDDLKDHKDATVLTKGSNCIKMQDNSLVIHPPNAVPFSDEWLAAFEAAGEEILTMKCGAVQHSPQDKSLPEPSPWSPVKRKANQIGPYDCTKYTNAMPSNSQVPNK